MAEFPISLLGLAPLATILRCVMTTMINFEAKPLLESICPTQNPGPCVVLLMLQHELVG